MSNFCRSPGFKVVLSLGSSWWTGVPREHGALPGDYASVRGLVVWWRIVVKPVARTLLLLGTFGSILAYSRNPKAQHVIIVIQENRTPDNAARLAAMQPETVRVQPMRRNLFH
jgi:hypothetical protein